MIEWDAVREAASRLLPKHAAVAGWKHRTLSHVEPMPKDRGAEPGDVDGLIECSLALGMVAADARLRVAAQQAARTLHSSWLIWWKMARASSPSREPTPSWRIAVVRAAISPSPSARSRLETYFHKNFPA